MPYIDMLTNCITNTRLYCLLALRQMSYIRMNYLQSQVTAQNIVGRVLGRVRVSPL